MAGTNRQLEVLIADDEEAVCFGLKRLLKTRGYIAHVAADGLNAVEAIRTHGERIAVAFLDVLMPRLDGFAALDQIRTIAPGVRCCLMTAHRQTPNIERALSMLDVRVLDKPFTLSNFVRVLNELSAVPLTNNPIPAATPSSLAPPRIMAAPNMLATHSSPRPRRSAGRRSGRKHVVLALPQHLGHWNALVRGAMAYARTMDHWFPTLHPELDLAPVLATGPDGVIGLVQTKELAAELAVWGGPVVDLADNFECTPFARVGFDDAAVGVLAAEHLLALGRRHLEFVGIEGEPSSERIHGGFADRLMKERIECECAPAAFWGRSGGVMPASDRDLGDWLRRLPRPMAVLCAHDAVALRLSEVCRIISLRVPDDIALLGVMNDKLLCESARPPLSSVRVPGQAVGFEAARMLDRLMNGKSVPEHPMMLPPLGIAIRQSTDITAVEDAELALALRFIREHAAERIGVNEVVEACHLSRSSLERRFRAMLGRSPLAELQRVRVEKAVQLLAETDVNLEDVARKSGFRDAEHLAATFRKRRKPTPAQYRARHKSM